MVLNKYVFFLQKHVSMLYRTSAKARSWWRQSFFVFTRWFRWGVRRWWCIHSIPNFLIWILKWIQLMHGTCQFTFLLEGRITQKYWTQNKNFTSAIFCCRNRLSRIFSTVACTEPLSRKSSKIAAISSCGNISRTCSAKEFNCELFAPPNLKYWNMDGI